MDNKKDLTKVLEGLTSAQNMLNTMLTPEILKQMTPEQLQQIEDAKKGIDNKGLQKASKDLENYMQNF
jgi:hypothetical protein